MADLRELIRAKPGYGTWEYGQLVDGPTLTSIFNTETSPIQISGRVDTGPSSAYTANNPELRIQGTGPGSSLASSYAVFYKFADIGGLEYIKANLPSSPWTGTPSVRIAPDLTGTAVVHDIGTLDCIFQLGVQPNWWSGTPVKPTALRFERCGWKYPIIGMCDNLTVDGMTGSSLGPYVAQTHFAISGDNVTVKNCDITINNEAGIKGGGKNRRFIDNKVVFNGEECFGLDASHGTFVRVTGKTATSIIVEWVSQHPILFHALPQNLSVSRKGSILGFITGSGKNQATMVTAHTANSPELYVDTTMLDMSLVSVGDVCSLNYDGVIDLEISGNEVTLVSENWNVGEGFNTGVSIFGTAFRTKINDNDFFHGSQTHGLSTGIHVVSATHVPSSYGMGAWCVADVEIANNRFHNVKHTISVENTASGVYLGLLANPDYQSKPFFRRSYMDNGSDDWPGGTVRPFESGIVPIGTPVGIRDVRIVGNEQTGGDRPRLMDVYDVYWDNPQMRNPETSYDVLQFETPPNYPMPDDPDYEWLTWDTWYKTIHWMETGDATTPLGALSDWNFLKAGLSGESQTNFMYFVGEPPAPPTAVNSTFDGTNITTSWTGLGTHQIRRRFDAGVWSDPTTATSPYTDSGLPATWDTAEYEVRAVVGSSYSEWVSSGAVVNESTYPLNFGTFSLPEPISGSGSLTFSGSGLLSAVLHSPIAGEGEVTFSGSGTLELAPYKFGLDFGMFSMPEPIAGGGAVNFNGLGSIVSVDPVTGSNLQGAGNIQISGSGTLSAVNPLSGSGDVIFRGSGILRIVSDGAVHTATVTIVTSVQPPVYLS